MKIHTAATVACALLTQHEIKIPPQSHIASTTEQLQSRRADNLSFGFLRRVCAGIGSHWGEGDESIAHGDKFCFPNKSQRNVAGPQSGCWRSFSQCSFTCVIPPRPPCHFPSYLPRTNSTCRLISRSVSPRVQPNVSGSAGNANRDNHAKEEGLWIVREGSRRQIKSDRERERGTNLPSQAVEHLHKCPSSSTDRFPKMPKSH